MFARHSSPWHLVCPELLSATSTEKSTQKLKSADHPWRKVWVKSGSVQSTQRQGPESGLCYEGQEEGAVSERAYPAGLEVMAPFALPQTSHMCFRHILHLSLAACPLCKMEVLPHSASSGSCKRWSICNLQGLSGLLVQVTLNTSAWSTPSLGPLLGISTREEAQGEKKP